MSKNGKSLDKGLGLRVWLVHEHVTERKKMTLLVSTVIFNIIVTGSGTDSDKVVTDRSSSAITATLGTETLNTKNVFGRGE